MNNVNSNKKGFTLIELLVVVLIIGILASIALPQYFKVVEKSRISEANNTFASIAQAQERALARRGLYTQSWDELDLTFRDKDNVVCTGDGDCVLKFFTYAISEADEDNFKITATRTATPAAPARYAAGYVITYEIPPTAGVGPFSCDDVNCQTDLIECESGTCTS